MEHIFFFESHFYISQNKNNIYLNVLVDENQATFCGIK